MANDRPVDLPPEIGPHEGRELELMLAGTKPMAMFSDALSTSDWFPEEDFAPYVDSGRFVRREQIYKIRTHDMPVRAVFYALSEEAWRIEAALRICTELFVDGRAATDEDEWTIGRLLGYSDSEITAFLNWTRTRRGAR